MRKEERIQQFVEEIWQWFSNHKRTLPWRDLKIADDTQRAYMVLVSEMMLQQTQVSRVIIIFKRFLEQFPTLSDLADASNKEVIIAWRGMGYNSRALRLRDAARWIRDRDRVRNEYNPSPNPVFPSSMEELQTIPGIGHYTAGAIRNFAFGIPTPCIDTNIRRILHRVFIGPENPDGTWKTHDKELLKIATEVLDAALEYIPKEGSAFLQEINTGKGESVRGKPLGLPFTRDWHAALMDFGSLVQTKKNPKWDICPLTAKGIMKTTPAQWTRNKSLVPSSQSLIPRKEPGRLVGSTHIPNRIFRGRIIEQLRDEVKGLSDTEIGSRISVDWNKKEHHEWLQSLLKKLVKDQLIAKRGAKYKLVE